MGIDRIMRNIRVVENGNQIWVQILLGNVHNDTVKSVVSGEGTAMGGGLPGNDHITDGKGGNAHHHQQKPKIKVGGTVGKWESEYLDRTDWRKVYREARKICLAGTLHTMQAHARMYIISTSLTQLINGNIGTFFVLNGWEMSDD